MIERPILFSGPMVRPVLADIKDVTRRIVRDQPDTLAPGVYGDRYAKSADWAWWLPDGRMVRPQTFRCPYGEPGDRLWVRETFQLFDPHPDGDLPIIGAERFARGRRAPHVGVVNDRPIEWTAVYRADGEIEHPDHGPANWKPSIFLPRWASRITLEVVSIRIERLHAITEEDARREGVRPFLEVYNHFAADQQIEGDRVDEKPYRTSFVCLWDQINADRALFSSNPFVWRVEFKRVPS